MVVWHGRLMETQYPVIEKPGPFSLPPNLGTYHETYQRFDWGEMEGSLDRLPDGGWNIAHETVDRHVP